MSFPLCRLPDFCHNGPVPVRLGEATSESRLMTSGNHRLRAVLILVSGLTLPLLAPAFQPVPIGRPAPPEPPALPAPPAPTAVEPFTLPSDSVLRNKLEAARDYI